MKEDICRDLYCMSQKKLVSAQTEQNTSPRNIRVQEGTLTFLGPGCFAYHI